MHERNMRAIRDQEAREAAIPNKVEVLGQELAAAFAAQFLPMNFQRRRDLPRFEAWLQHWLHPRMRRSSGGPRQETAYGRRR